MKKKLALIVASVLALSSIPAVSYASESEDSINIVVSGSALECDQPPVIIEGRTLIPLRAVAEAVGAEVDWDSDTKTVEVNKDGIDILLAIGAKTVSIDGQDAEIDVPAQIINERTMVPIRFVAESLGLEVGWDESTKTVSIDYASDTSSDEETTEETTEAAADEDSTETSTEQQTETTTAETKTIKSGESNYSNKDTGKKTVTDSIVIDDYTVYTASATYDTIDGNDAYNEFAENLAKEYVAKNMADTGANRKTAFAKLSKDEYDDFTDYKTVTNIEAVYYNDVVVSTKITTKYYKETLIYNTEVSTMLTDPTGANTVNVSDITGGTYTDDDVYALGIEKFNALFDSDKTYTYFERVKNGALTQDMLNICMDMNGNFLVYANRGVVADSGKGEVSVVITMNDLVNARRAAANTQK